jgi:hypothetical protein
MVRPQLLRQINPILKSALGAANYRAYTTRKFSSNFVPQNILGASFTLIEGIDSKGVSAISAMLSSKIPVHNSRASAIDLRTPSVLRIQKEDVDLSDADKTSSVIVAAGSEIEVRYGERGIAPSQKIMPTDLLRYKLLIPKGSFGVLDIVEHVPFQMICKGFEKSFAMSTSELAVVRNHEENIRRYSLNIVSELPADMARRLSIKMQDRIFGDRNYQMFYKEITSIVYKPTEDNRSSLTLMNFDREELMGNSSAATETHYHPGERALMIFTTNKEAGVTLNFCGINEAPDERPDCEVHLKFERNKIYMLIFPPYTHHRFEGEFVCGSFHPREGQQFIKSVQLGILPKGFLESATVFSLENSGEKEWSLSLPVMDTPSKTPTASAASTIADTGRSNDLIKR